MSAKIASSVSSSAVLHDVDWATYTRFLEVFGKKRFRHTYDRGRLEIMSPIGFEHDNRVYLLGRVVDELVEQLGIDYVPGRSVTMRKRKKMRGLEPDNAYWIANASRMLGKKGPINFQIDPPPDLAIEVEMSRTVLKRLKIFVSLGVPEVWRLKADGSMIFYGLKEKKYVVESVSRSFPMLRSDDLSPFVKQMGAMRDIELVKQFRQWLSARLLSWRHPASTEEQE